MKNNVDEIVFALRKGEVVAYPTEAVFGLGCDPHNESAVRKLLFLKQRPEHKGLILVAPTLDFFTDFVDFNALSPTHLQRLQHIEKQAITWVVPVLDNVSPLLRGQFNSIAIRLCQHPPVVELCKQTGFALTSTSANLTGKPPCRSVAEVYQQFGRDFPVLTQNVGQASNPSEIRDIFTHNVFRQG